MYGVNSAPEMCQKIIQQIIQDIPNSKIIADDIIIYCNNQKQHDETLGRLLQRLREKNFTLKKSKCVFNKPELKFMGHILSKDEIKAENSNIDAVRNFLTPTVMRQIKLFLGLVSFCGKFKLIINCI